MRGGPRGIREGREKGRGRGRKEGGGEGLTCGVGIDVDGGAVDGVIRDRVNGAVEGTLWVQGTHPLHQVQSEGVRKVHSSPCFPQLHLLYSILCTSKLLLETIHVM